ncbi:MAG: hypothetical protein M3Q23_14090 [Actinomycetota bacterium]|nr:hypothetical protein [Actinomycetota bacterium]
MRTLKVEGPRYPGHAAWWRALRDAGLFGTEPVAVGGVQVPPRDVLHALLEPRIPARPGSEDVVIAGAVARAPGARATVDVRVHADRALGFTAMDAPPGGATRSSATGWPAAASPRAPRWWSSPYRPAR